MKSKYRTEFKVFGKTIRITKRPKATVRTRKLDIKRIDSNGKEMPQ